MIFLLNGCNYRLHNVEIDDLKRRDSTSSLIGCKPISPAFKLNKNNKSVQLYGSVHRGTQEMKDEALQYAKKFLPNANYLYTETGMDVGILPPDFINRNNTLIRADDLFLDSPEHFSEWRKLYGDQIKLKSKADIFLALTSTSDVYLRLDQEVSSLEQFNYRFGVDSVLIDEAKRLGIPLRTLETNEIPQIISEFSDDDLKQYSKQTWRMHEKVVRGELSKNNFPSIVISVSEMVSLWCSGDVDKIAYITDSNEALELSGSAKPLKKIFNEIRNKKMAEKIDAEIASSDFTPVVLVGTYHLAGKNGLLSLLKNRGYAITCQ
jgi:uncharacterized protein YbaP (TraB family)